MNKPNVLIDPLFRRMSDVYSPENLGRLGNVAEIVWAKDEPAPKELVDEVAPELDAIVSGYWNYGEVARFPRLRAFLESGGSLPAPDKLDYGHCFAQGVRVLSCAPAFGPFVAEMGLGLALSAARRIAQTDRAFHADGTENWSHTDVGDAYSLYGKTVGLIGFGGLARALRPLLAPFSPKLLVHDPWMTDAYLKGQGVEPVSVERLLAESQLAFVLATVSVGNKAYLDRERLSLLRPDAVLILLSRAHVVDFDALTELLLAGRFRAGIDVFPEEPLDRDHPIRGAQNAILTSHRAGTTVEALRAIGEIVTDDLEAILTGKIPQRMQAAQPEYLRLRAQS